MPMQAVNYAALPVPNMGVPDITGSLMRGFQLGIAPTQFQQEMEKNRIANALAQINLQYAPEMTQAELAYKQAMTPHLNAQTGHINAQTGLTNQQAKYYGQDIMSQIDLRNAQTANTNENTKYIPLEQLINAQKAQSIGDRFGNAYQFSKTLQMLPPAARATFIADNPEQISNMLSTMGNKTLENQSSQQNATLQNAIASIFPQYANPQQQMPQQQGMQMPGGQGGMAPQGMPPPQMNNNAQNIQPASAPNPNSIFSQATPEQIARFTLANQLSANKDLITAATRRQNEGGMQVASMMNDPGLQSQVVSAAEYAGALGKGKAAVAAFSQKNPEGYENYISLKNQVMPVISNRIKTVDGMGATDAQREELNNMFNKTMDSLTSNPKQFVQQFNKLGETLDKVEASVNASASPIFQDPRKQGFKPINQNMGNSKQSAKNYSQEDLQHTADKYGISVDQVKQKLGIQ